jgi:hypothetical protein
MLTRLHVLIMPRQSLTIAILDSSAADPSERSDAVQVLEAGVACVTCGEDVEVLEPGGALP